MEVKIMMAISGSGKSTWIKNDAVEKKEICSADLFFMDDGDYKFDRTKLGEAHGHCLKMFIKKTFSAKGNAEMGKKIAPHLNRNPDVLYVDNTNTTEGEIAPYIAIARAYGIEPQIIHLNVLPEIAGPRNTHGVPQKSIENMYRNIERLKKHWPHHWPTITEV